MFATVLTTFGVVMVTTQAFTTLLLGDVHYQLLWGSLQNNTICTTTDFVELNIEVYIQNSQKDKNKAETATYSW